MQASQSGSTSLSERVGDFVVELHDLVADAITWAFEAATVKYGQTPEAIHQSAVTDQITARNAYAFEPGTADEAVHEVLCRLQTSGYFVLDGNMVRLTEKGRTSIALREMFGLPPVQHEPRPPLARPKVEYRLLEMLGRFSHWEVAFSFRGGPVRRHWALTQDDEQGVMGISVAQGHKPITLGEAIPRIEKYLADREREEPVYLEACRLAEKGNHPDLGKMKAGWATRNERLRWIAEGLEELRKLLSEQDAH